MAEGSFATAVVCIDGRVQRPVFEWVRAFAKVDYVDMVTIPGPDIALRTAPAWVVDVVRHGIEISLTEHGSREIAIAGHHACAAHRVSDEQHIADIQATARQVAATWSLPARIVGLWVNDRWQVELVWDSASGGSTSRNA